MNVCDNLPMTQTYMKSSSACCNLFFFLLTTILLFILFTMFLRSVRFGPISPGEYSIAVRVRFPTKNISKIYVIRWTKIHIKKKKKEQTMGPQSSPLLLFLLLLLFFLTTCFLLSWWTTRFTLSCHLKDKDFS
jgi:hypothetical protein